MTSSTLHDRLKEFDFDGEDYHFDHSYDIREENDIALLDQDSEDAASSVQELGLSYDIDARHYSTVVKGDRITDMVDVTWKFWKE